MVRWVGGSGWVNFGCYEWMGGGGGGRGGVGGCLVIVKGSEVLWGCGFGMDIKGTGRNRGGGWKWKEGLEE
jgi:hypothetical protein